MAVLHAAVALLCLLSGIPDSLALTLLTMVMIVLLCIRKRLTVEFTAIMIVLVNIFGFILGTLGADLLALINLAEIPARALASFLTTEALGWGMLLFVHFFPARIKSTPAAWRENIGWLVAAITIIFTLRVAIDLILASSDPDTYGSVRSVMEVAAFCLAFVLYFALRMRSQAEIEKEKTHQAEYRYMALKQQVNPHFLFNSLNILDSLVADGEKENASWYIHQLSSIYRYMLQHEGEALVRISEELVFAKMYEDLLRVRFPEGFVVETDIREEDGARFIVPCSLQLLIENATKHNAVMPDRPLKIRISADADGITVTNVRIPKVGKEPDSTGLGLKYIRKQYEDLAHRGVEIVETADNYSVKLPLI